MATRDWAGLAAGLALAGFGLGAYVASGSQSVPEPAPAPAAVIETVPAVETVVDQPVDRPAFEIPGLSGAASRILANAGYAEIAPQSELGLPASLVRVLEREGVVLLVPDGDGS